MKRIALDTNIAIDLLNGQKDVISFLDAFDEINLPVVVCGELLFGALNSKRRNENLSKFRAFISACSVISANLVTAEDYAKIRNQLKAKGGPIPENDIWIAAICFTNNIPLISRDKHLKKLNLFPWLSFDKTTAPARIYSFWTIEISHTPRKAG